MSVFDSYRTKAFPHQYAGQLLVSTIAGGTPTDPKVAEGWLKTKLVTTTEGRDDLIREAVGQAIADRGISPEEALAVVDSEKHLNGFKRDEQGLYIEGRQLKAAIKEAAMVAFASKKISGAKWGATGKGLKGFVAEHIFVVEDRLHLGVTEAAGIMQRFVHTFRGTGIQYEEYVEDAKISFTVAADWEFSDEFWAMLWLTGEQQGIGASRSQGFGRYEITAWDPQ